MSLRFEARYRIITNFNLHQNIESTKCDLIILLMEFIMYITPKSRIHICGVMWYFFIGEYYFICILFLRFIYYYFFVAYLGI